MSAIVVAHSGIDKVPSLAWDAAPMRQAWEVEVVACLRVVHYAWVHAYR